MSVPRLELANATPKAVCDALAEIGAIIVEGVLSDEHRTRVLHELRPFIDETARGADGFSGHLTTRTGALAARSAAARELIMHPLAVQSARAFIGPFCGRIQLHVTQVIRILPGQTAQPLHRDRWAWGQHLPDAVEPQFNTMWALTEFTRANGATVIAPGSVSWKADRSATLDELTQAEMPAGSVLFFSGSVIHGGGANETNDVRVGVNIDYCLDWLRQEENQYLSCPPHVARDLAPELRELLGYAPGATSLGYYSLPDLKPGQAGVLWPS